MPFVLATVVRVVRPTSAKAGDCALVLPDGTIDGFVGGDCAESTVRLQALRQLMAGQSTLLRITPAGGVPEPSGEGLVTVANPCLSGGTLDIFLEVMSPPMLVHVFGESPVARALAAVGAAMGWDMRAATQPDAPIPPDTAAVVVASHGGDEARVLTAALRAGSPYVGLVASRRRGGAVVSGLDLTPAQRDRLHTPAGLDIAASGPAEIAVSILAEVIASRASVPPRPAGEAAGTVARPVGHPASRPAGGDVAGPGAGAAAGSTPAVPVATDPVCGMTVAVAAESARLEHAGATWYFCGAGCRTAFAADPAPYEAAATRAGR